MRLHALALAFALVAMVHPAFAEEALPRARTQVQSDAGLPAASAPAQSDAGLPAARAPAQSDAGLPPASAPAQDTAPASVETPISVETPEPATPNPAAPKLLGAEATIGLGAPGGWAALGLALRPTDFLTLHGGVGMAYDGLQLFAGARAQPLTFGRRVRLGLGAGYSTGEYATWTVRRYWPRAHWVFAEAFVSMRLGAGFELRPFLCISIALNPQAGVYVPATAPMITQSRGPERFYSLPGFGVAGAFDLL